MAIDYDHSKNPHSTAAARVVLPLLRDLFPFSSVLDVGCGIGTWLSVAAEQGAKEHFGIDGIAIAQDRLLFDHQRFARRNFDFLWALPGRYDLAICLEVAEHLQAASAPGFIRCVCNHADLVLFSAAAPHQPGQHHVNCQWPEYWQALFNENQFECLDVLRMRIWQDDRVDPWYRQNIFVARRNATVAGAEPRIRGMIHPIIYLYAIDAARRHEQAECLRRVREGCMPVRWYDQSLIGFARSILRSAKRSWDCLRRAVRKSLF